MLQLKVIICGGGIAGPAAAFWLAKLGHSCTIVERFPELRTQGQQIDIREQGVEAAGRMGLLDEIRCRAVDEEGTAFVDARGKTVAFFGRSGSEEHQSFTSEFEIMRGELCRILHEATPRDRVSWRFGVTVDDLVHIDDGRRVRVRFSNGETANYDLVVGADGQGSRVRRKMAPDAEADAYRAFGVFYCYFNMRRQPEDDRSRFTLYAGGQRRTLATRWHSKDHGQGYLMTMSHAEEMRDVLQQRQRQEDINISSNNSSGKDKDTADNNSSQDKGNAENSNGNGVVARQKDLFARVFFGAGWQADRLMRQMQQADDVYFFEALQVRTQPWFCRRVVLLGDAAHAPSFTGMGTSLALVGAYVLAGELSRACSTSNDNDAIAVALAAYDRQLRPFVEETQKLAPGFPGAMFPNSRRAFKITHFVLWLMVLLKANRIGGAVMRFLMPGNKKWRLPSYPALETQEK